MAINMDDPRDVTAEFHAIMRANRMLLSSAQAAAARSRVLARLARDGLVTDTGRQPRTDDSPHEFGH